MFIGYLLLSGHWVRILCLHLLRFGRGLLFFKKEQQRGSFATPDVSRLVDKAHVCSLHQVACLVVHGMNSFLLSGHGVSSKLTVA